MGYDPFDDCELSNLPPDAFSPFFNPREEPFDPQDHWLRTANKDEQRTAMREWFRARYCDPAHETPYNSQEGGYLFIYGGPYDPADVLSNRFSGIVGDDSIQEVIDEMHDEVGVQWAPIHYGPPDDFDYDERFDLGFKTRDEPLGKLKERLHHAQRVLTLEGDEAAKLLAKKLVFGAAVAALEAFLWETVDYCVEHEEKALRDIVTKIPALRDQPMKLGEIFEQHEGLKERVKGYLQNLVWHRWDKVVPLFKLGLGIQPPSFKLFDDALVKRHDIVHRSGHDKAGNPILVTTEEIQELCERIEAFSTEIDTKLAQRDLPF
ncbi:MAG: hypothetical protein M0P59_09140 [Gallionella sp.]|jgi:hypothetical protein|nr:hypothetical protein [Gallionella sp.]MCK9354313.1 hypothetical protein [Gallionella sp.]